MAFQEDREKAKENRKANYIEKKSNIRLNIEK